MTPSIELLIIGNEILSGRTIDRNASFLIHRLAEAGFSARHITVVGDDMTDLVRAFRIAEGRADIVLATGGLGPTSDDLTVEAASRAFGRNLVLDEGVLRAIEELFRRRKRFMSDSNRRQAMLPEGATAIPNPLGTAPGIRMNSGGTVVYLMPGVPGEMQAIFSESVLPEITRSFEPEQVETASIRVTGMSESELYDTIRRLPGAREAFAFYPNPEGILVRIRTGKDAPMGASALRDDAKSLLGERVYSTNDESLEQVVGRLLKERRKKVGVAESCTGGLIAHRLTNIPGSSDYFLCGVIAYSNESKQEVLGVDPALIARYGAVSAEVAAAMAEGVRRISGADIGISTTGIAGPGGGSIEKPIGLMFAGYSAKEGKETKKLHFAEERIINKHRMSQAVLDILRIHLESDF
jgi:nicotinamide-nucleotide amidase